MSEPALLSRLWREIKRRRIPQVVSTYFGLAWITIEAIPMILSNLGVAPATADTAASAVTVFWVALFPLALTLTWMYQVVPDPGQSDAAAPVRRLRRVPVAVALVVVSGGCMALATSLWPPTLALAAPPRPEIRNDVIALLPPVVLLGDAHTGQVADCIVNRLTTRLGLLSGISVRSAAAVRSVGGASLPPDSAAALLGAGTLLTSTAEGMGDSIRMTFRIIDPASGTNLRAVSVVESLPSGDGTFERFAGTLEVEVRKALGQARPALRDDGESRDPGAQERMRQAATEEEVYRRHAAAGNVDAALAALSRADAALAEASSVDPSWPAPLARRSWVARTRALLLLTHDRAAALRSVDSARRLADQALHLAPGDPEALRLRGLASWQAAAFDTSAALGREALLHSADADLRRAQRWHRDRAEVLYELALVKKEQGLLPDAYVFASDAYAWDAYMALTDRLVAELFHLAFQLAYDDDASAWCQEGNRRFPDQWVFKECGLRLMGWGIAPPDTARARSLAAEALAAYPQSFRGLLAPHLETLVAAVQVQAGDTSGAKARLELTPLGSTPAVHLTAAGVWLLLGEDDRAMEELLRYAAQAPGEAHRLARQRTLRPLATRPDFRALVAGGGR
jgi:TolB-like protein